MSFFVILEKGGKYYMLKRQGNGMVVMAVTAAAISSAVALGIAKTQNAQFKAMDKARDERIASQYAQDRVDVIRSTKYSSLEDARLSRQQIGSSNYYEEVTVEPSGGGDEKIIRVNVYKGATSGKAISTLSVKRRNPGSIQVNLMQEPGMAIDAAMSQKAATDTFVMRNDAYNKTETEFFVRQEIATALFDALKQYLPRTEAEQVYRLCSESYSKGDTDSLMTALETVLNGKTDANRGKIDVLNTYFDTNGYAKRAIADGNGNNIVNTYMTKAGMSSYLTTSGKAASAGTADSATKATQDGNGNNIASTYRKIVDSYTKAEVDAKDGTKLNTSGGTMTGDISYKGSQSTNSMIRFMNNTSDPYGNGISIGGGGEAIFGAGESASAMQGNVSAGNEDTYITADGSVHIRTNMDSGYNGNNKQFSFGSNGNLTVPGAMYEGGTALSSKYLGISSKAASAAYADRAYPRRSDGGSLNFYWSGQSGQPSWLWGGNDGANMYVYNPSNFSVNYANSAGSASSASSSTTLTYSGLNNGVVTAAQTSGDFKGKSGWASYLIFNHGDGNTYYNQTIRMPFWGAPEYGRAEGNGSEKWYSFVTSENIGSQTVNKATYDSSGNHIANMFSSINSAVNAKLASSTFTSTGVTHGANIQVGSASNPVYIASNGVATAGTYSFNRSDAGNGSDSTQVAVWNGNTLQFMTRSKLGASGGIPAGTIVMWSGSSIPSGWALCNGSNGTPDLRDRFIVGAGSSYGLGAKGGEATHTLTVSELPAHAHGGWANAAGSHSHTVNVDTQGVPDGAWDHWMDGRRYWNSTWASDGKGSTAAAGEHGHSVSGSNAGGSGAHENRPPYYALYYIMKL